MFSPMRIIILAFFLCSVSPMAFSSCNSPSQASLPHSEILRRAELELRKYYLGRSVNPDRPVAKIQITRKADCGWAIDFDFEPSGPGNHVTVHLKHDGSLDYVMPGA